jgi:hypothetical protein
MGLVSSNNNHKGTFQCFPALALLPAPPSSTFNRRAAAVPAGTGNKSHLEQLTKQSPGRLLSPTMYPGLASHSPDSAQIGHSDRLQRNAVQ